MALTPLLRFCLVLTPVLFGFDSSSVLRICLVLIPLLRFVHFDSSFEDLFGFDSSSEVCSVLIPLLRIVQF